MNVKKSVSLLLSLIFMISLLTACGASSGASKNHAVMEEVMAEAPAAMANGSTNDSLTSAAGGGSNAIPENRKWIITVYMSAETEDLDTMTAALDERIAELDGYVEDQHIYNGSAYASRRYRSANLTIRIPAESVDQFTEQVSGIANVVSQEKNLEDITLNYVSTESRMTALQTEEARLLELMAQAETMSDLLEIESRLTDVRYELESVTSRLRTYDNQINYATIHLDISEVQEYTPVEEPTFFERIKTTFSDALEGLGNGIVNITVFLVGNSPYLLVYGGIAALVILLMKRSSKLRFKRKAKKDDQK